MEPVGFRILAALLLIGSLPGCTGGATLASRPAEGVGQSALLAGQAWPAAEPGPGGNPQIAPAPPRIEVAPHGWGGGNPATIKLVLDAVAAELMSKFPGRPLAPIHVSRSSGAPVALYDRSPGGGYRIELNASGAAPGPYIYEFAHEFCHVLSNYDLHSHLKILRKQQWFEEAMCEVASLYALKTLSAVWQLAAPSAELAAAAPKLREIEQAFRRESHRNLPPGTTLATWYRSASAGLADTPYDRKRNEVVANLLLPLFEENPDLWGALRFLNLAAPADSFQQYLQSWLDSAPLRYKDVIRYTMSLFFEREPTTADATGSFPQRPIEIIVTFGPGGGADGMARKLAGLLAPRLGVPVLVTNVPGAAGNAGLTRMLLSADPDHTMVTLIALTVAAWAEGVGNLGPDDFTVLGVAQDSQSMLFVDTDSPILDFSDFLARARARPAHLRVATSGYGTIDDLTLALLAKAGYETLNAPFANPRQRYEAALERRTDALFEEPGDISTHLASGRLRPLVAFADRRQPEFPQVPAISEFGISIGDLPNFRSLAVSAKLAPEKVTVLVKALRQALDSDEWKRYCAETYSCADADTPEGAKARVKAIADRVASYREGLR